LVTVTGSAALVVFTTWLPKPSEVGETDTCASAETAPPARAQPSPRRHTTIPKKPNRRQPAVVPNPPTDCDGALFNEEATEGEKPRRTTLLKLTRSRGLFA
jgi:hypothetical protein